MLPQATLDDAETLLDLCRDRMVRLATVESCTGGLVAAALTAIAWSSDVVDRGFVTYTNAAKHQQVGVPLDLIASHGAVSEEVARAMAEGGLARSEATIAVSVTGIAGPGGSSPGKPVGLVCFGLAQPGQPTATESHVFPGDRAAVRAAAVAHVLGMIRTRL